MSGSAISDSRGANDARVDVVVLPRCGRPPLRLRARPVRRHEMVSIGGRVLHITLWERPNGQHAVSYSRPESTRLAEEAEQAADRDALAAILEETCRHLDQVLTLPPEPELEDLVNGQIHLMLEHDFRFLVGSALSDWGLEPAESRQA